MGPYLSTSDRACSFGVTASLSLYYDVISVGCEPLLFFGEHASSYAYCGPDTCYQNSWNIGGAFAAGERIASSVYRPNAMLRLPILGQLEDKGRVGCLMSQGKLEKKGQTVTLRDIKAILRYGKGFGNEAMAQVLVWYADNPVDTLITEKKILWEGKVSLSNGSLRTYGGFDSKFVRPRTITPDSVVMEFNMEQYTIILPENIDMQRVVVTYHSDSRGGLDGRAQIESLKTDFSLYPNPVGSQLNIGFQSQLEEDTEVSVFYGPNQSLKNTFILKKGQKSYQIDATNLPEGLLIIDLHNKNAIFERKRILKSK
jgi:hypothetical protein